MSPPDLGVERIKTVEERHDVGQLSSNGLTLLR
jgi:hypothetical protein